MNKSKFIGKKINPKAPIKKELVEGLTIEESEFFGRDEPISPESFVDPQVLHIYLGDYSKNEFNHNFFSIQILLHRDRIIDIIRIGHFHMGGGEGVDDELNLFPSRRLEAEVTQILTALTVM